MLMLDEDIEEIDLHGGIQAHKLEFQHFIRNYRIKKLFLQLNEIFFLKKGKHFLKKKNSSIFKHFYLCFILSLKTNIKTHAKTRIRKLFKQFSAANIRRKGEKS